MSLDVARLPGVLEACVGHVKNDLPKPKTPRQAKQFSMFQVVQFANIQCNGSASMTGTCYTEDECTSKNGVSIGTCANGFGVCCRMVMSCGETSSENITVFADTNVPTGMGECTASINPANTDVRQIRLDFERFQIAGPSLVSSEVTKILNGSPSFMGTPNAAVGQCNLDRFQVQGGSHGRPPIICGLNTGQHMLLDVDESSNIDLSFQFGSVATVRSFQIRVTQYEMNSPNLAPAGCTQYFTSASGTGVVQTYNFGNVHLADQSQVMCVRQIQNACRICWTVADDADFAVSGSVSFGIGGSTQVESCCGPNSKGSNKQGLDCLSLPSAENKEGTARLRSRFCGRNKGLTTGPAVSITICSKLTPFQITFRSDSFETIPSIVGTPLPEATAMDKGVKLIYFQDNMNCMN
ncbi:uncharacterized protein LOC131891509 [Tigriopus californicus]|uniref:uncharacterized protein LOC131891509 n=1 Tax=Tigriopus californicus TaxID=6832 RepID=UPI0027DA93CC|nr:uncharacterized protein LOC131891509 [Tigriopus californicus]